MRSIFKRVLMDAYCMGLLPAWCIKAAFKAFKLGAK